MSIKRISRKRVAAPVAEYVIEEPLATRVGTNIDTRAGGPEDTRAGGDGITKASPAVESPVGGSRVDTRIDTKYSTELMGIEGMASGDIQSRVGTNVDTKRSPELHDKESRIGDTSGRDSPTNSRWSV